MEYVKPVCFKGAKLWWFGSSTNVYFREVVNQFSPSAGAHSAGTDLNASIKHH